MNKVTFIILLLLVFLTSKISSAFCSQQFSSTTTTTKDNLAIHPTRNPCCGCKALQSLSSSYYFIDEAPGDNNDDREAHLTKINRKTLQNRRDRSELLFPERLNIIYDGKCNICVLTVKSLQKRMKEVKNTNDTNNGNLLRFTNLEDEIKPYNPDDVANGGVRYETAMSSFHAVRNDGTIISGVQVFREAYGIVGLGWMFAIADIPIIGTNIYNLWTAIYKFCAKCRTDITRGASLDELVDLHYKTMNNDDCIPCKKRKYDLDT